MRELTSDELSAISGSGTSEIIISAGAALVICATAYITNPQSGPMVGSVIATMVIGCVMNRWLI